MTRCYKVAQYVMKCINGSDNMRMFAAPRSENNILYIKTIRKHRYLPPYADGIHRCFRNNVTRHAPVGTCHASPLLMLKGATVRGS